MNNLYSNNLSSNNLSFNELKILLKNCKNPSEELIIRRRMKEKYLSYIKYKNRNTNNLQYNGIQNNNYGINESNNEELIDNLLDELDQYKSNSNYIENKLTDENGEDEEDKLRNNMSRDHMNNNLVNRMRNDILIKKNSGNLGKGRINKRDFIPPFQ